MRTNPYPPSPPNRNCKHWFFSVRAALNDEWRTFGVIASSAHEVYEVVMRRHPTKTVVSIDRGPAVHYRAFEEQTRPARRSPATEEAQTNTTNTNCGQWLFGISGWRDGAHNVFGVIAANAAEARAVIAKQHPAMTRVSSDIGPEVHLVASDEQTHDNR